MERTINILIVDDEQIVLDSITKHLRKEDFHLECVLSAQQALEYLGGNKVDIVLTDLMMPEIDGLELMKLVKDKDPDIPVVMITGYATINTALQATHLGAFDYVAKPFSKKELLAVVRRAADLVAAKDEGATTEGAPADTDMHQKLIGSIKSTSERSWMMLLEDGTVMLGAVRSFLQTIGRIQTIYLPDVGDEIRQGSAYIQIFSSDLRSHNILCPLSGQVVEVNERVRENPMAALEDPYDEGWMIKLKPSKFDFEVKQLGL